MKRLFILILIACFTLPIVGQAQEKTEETEKAPEIKTWAIPPYHWAYLEDLIEEFNKLWESELDRIKVDLQKNYRGYESMPIKDVVFDRAKGYFIHREDFLTLQKEAAIPAPIKKDPEKK